MAYEPTEWKNREVERPRTFQTVSNTDGSITLIPAEGQITEAGTPIVATNMNKIENQLVAMDVDAVDFTKHIPYVNAASSNGTAYTATLPGVTSYREGMGLSVKIARANSGAATININNLGAKQIIKSNGNTVSAGNLKLNSVYTLRYNGTHFIQQGEGGEGTATTAQVLNGATFTNDAGTFTGTMTNRTGVTTDATRVGSGNTYIDVAPATGYYDGINNSRARVTDANFSPANIKNGVNVFGVTGNYAGQFAYTNGQLTLQGAQSNDKSTFTFTFNAGFPVGQFGYVISYVSTGQGTYKTAVSAFHPAGTGAGGFVAGGAMYISTNNILELSLSGANGASSYKSGNLVYIHGGLISQYSVDPQTVSITVFAWSTTT